MNFTPRISPGTAASRILKIAVVGLFGWFGHVSWGDIVQTQTLAAQGSIQGNRSVSVISAVDFFPAPGLQSAAPANYLPVSDWYKSKAWWKKHAPIIGGAAGGGLIGGLAGGGKGALIGGAAGAGGGYLYEHLRKSNHHSGRQNQHSAQGHHNTANRSGTMPKQPEERR